MPKEITVRPVVENAVLRLRASTEEPDKRKATNLENGSLGPLIDCLHPNGRGGGGAVDWLKSKEGFRVHVMLTGFGTVGFLALPGTNHVVVAPLTKREQKGFKYFRGPVLVPKVELVPKKGRQKPLEVTDATARAVLRLRRAADVQKTDERKGGDMECRAADALYESLGVEGSAESSTYTQEGFRVLVETRSGSTGFLIPPKSDHVLVKPPTTREEIKHWSYAPILIPVTRLVPE